MTTHATTSGEVVAAPSATVVVRALGLQPYAEMRDSMLAFTRSRQAHTPDEIWLVEHPPVYTLGQAGRLVHLRRAVDIPVVHTERGGQITYHGPGQAIAYLMVDLRRRGIKVREFVRLIEASVIDVLAAYNFVGRVKPGAPGVYVEHAGSLQKIAALGLKIVNGCSFHGVSLNVAMDLSPYQAIDACGDPALESIDLASLGATATVGSVGTQLAAALTIHLTSSTEALTL